MNSQLDIRHDQSLRALNTFGIDAKAYAYVQICGVEHLRVVRDDPALSALRRLVLGGGSNLLLTRDFDGLVLHMSNKGIVVSGDDESSVYVTAQAGENWHGFVQWTLAQGYPGLENLSLIPGSVGASPIQNIGAYGQEVSETIGSVRAFDLESGEFVDFENESCGFAYRRSVFNSTLKGRHVIVSVTFLLKPGGIPSLRYPELQSRFGGVVPTLAEVRETVCEIRRSKGMLVRQGGPDSRSAGSFFKNPIIGDELRQRILAVSLENGFGEPPMFPSEGRGWKVSAAWLVEKSGFPKGFRMGPAGVSSSHSLALVNAGGAKCRDILALRDLITVAVKKEFGVELVQEPVFIGDSE